MPDARRVLRFATVIAATTVTLPASTPLRPPSDPVAFPDDDGSWKMAVNGVPGLLSRDWVRGHGPTLPA